jgi:hypothetical protein
MITNGAKIKLLRLVDNDIMPMIIEELGVDDKDQEQVNTVIHLLIETLEQRIIDDKIWGA